MAKPLRKKGLDAPYFDTWDGVEVAGTSHLYARENRPGIGEGWAHSIQISRAMFEKLKASGIPNLQLWVYNGGKYPLYFAEWFKILIKAKGARKQ